MKPTLEQIFASQPAKPPLSEIFASQPAKPPLSEIFGVQPKPKETFLGGIKSDFKSRVNKATEAQEKSISGEQSIGSGALQTIGQGAGFVGDIAIQGLKAITPESVEKAVETGIQKIAETKPVQDITTRYTEWAVKNPEASANLEATINIASLLPGVKGVTKGIEAVGSGLTKAGKATTTAIKETGENIANKVVPKPDEIMNRVARLTPKQANNFERLAGKTHGEYLRETGNFGTPDEIIKNEATKFAESIKSVDDTLATLPGLYQDGSIADAITGLKEKAIATSSANVKSPILSKVLEFETKFTNEGLTMSEINELKRLYERQVKLGYNKTLNPDKVELATNIDNALREWQVNKAKELGFENISELNKQTQLSKFIVDNLGEQIVGKTGLNNVGLTDWVVLSGGDPTAVGAFLTKKFFGSKKIQAKIAEMLNKGEIKGQITPKVTPSKPPKQ